MVNSGLDGGDAFVGDKVEYVNCAALAYSRDESLPAIIELRYDGNLITPNATLETIRKTAEAAQSRT